jgi:hypothetical protein
VVGCTQPEVLNVQQFTLKSCENCKYIVDLISKISFLCSLPIRTLATAPHVGKLAELLSSEDYDGHPPDNSMRGIFEVLFHIVFPVLGSIERQ